MKHAATIVSCATCGIAFRAYVSQRRRFCSRDCRYASLRGKPAPNRRSHLDPDYFWSFVDKTDACWMWNGHRNPAGYGHISVKNRLVLAHRHAWALERGPIPAGMFVLHHCDNPPCVRPDHLYIGTKRDNARDMHTRGRARDNRGDAHPQAKLNSTQVLKIRAALRSGESESSLAEKYGVNFRTINYIGKRRTWRHLPENSNAA